MRLSLPITAFVAAFTAAAAYADQPAAKSTPAPAPAINLAGVQDKGDWVVAGVPDLRAEVRERMLQYLNVRSANLIDTNDEGKPLKEVLITTRFGNTAQAHKLAMPGGARTQLTFYDEPVASARFVPGSDGKRILLLRDAGGTEDFRYFTSMSPPAAPRC